VETSLALSRCIKLGQTTFEAFKRQLQLIRYRAGVIDEYPSRLHYFSDWIDDNGSKNIIRDITKEVGGTRYSKRINFMSVHRSAYRQLVNAGFLEQINEREKRLTSRDHFHVPKQQLSSLADRIFNGDILAMTTSIEGLDISHTGLAVRSRGTLKFLHAPLTNGVVQITESSLVDFLMSRESNAGIMIARPLEPNKATTQIKEKQ
jgi:hypothetical protein